MRVSVLLPCYNAADTISATLDTLFAQTLPDIEIVAVDDGSTDATPSILETYQQKHPSLRVLRCPHRGIIPTLNEGLRACRAPYIARMDADDLAYPTRLTAQATYLDQHPEIALVSCLVEGFPADDVRDGFRIYLNWLNGLQTHEQIAREIFIESPLPHPSVMFRRDAVRALGGYVEKGWPEDYDLWLRMYLNGARFAKVPETLVAWREHPNRLTRTDRRYSVENFIRAKAHYLVRGPLHNRDGVIIWGAGMMGRRLSKHLTREGAPLACFIDIDPKKIGKTKRGLPIIAVGELDTWWERYERPILLAAVAARGARNLIREQLEARGYVEGRNWLSVA